LNIEAEYLRIYNRLFEGTYTERDIISIIEEGFEELPTYIRGRTRSLSDFNMTYKFSFPQFPIHLCVDDIISLCEYAWNLSKGVLEYACNILGEDSLYDLEQFLKMIRETTEALHHTLIVKNRITIFVPQNHEVISVSEIVDNEVALNILEYHHHALKGNLSKKKAILHIMADDIETQRKTLNSINKTFADNLFQMLQKFVRHNNEDNPYIKGLSSDELETCYDDIYQMWLLAKLEIDNLKRKKRVETVLQKINS
jgi:hypothetical protein